MFGSKKSVAVEEPPVQLEGPTAPNRNWVHEMAATAVTVAPPGGDIEGEIDRLSKLHEEMLAIEGEAKSQVASRVEALKASRELPYPRLSLEPLGWTKDNRPVFAVYPLSNPLCMLRAWMDGRRLLPRPIQMALDGGWPGDGFGSTLVSRFTGVLPAPIREKILEARPHFGEDIYVIAEANWKAVPRPKGDPLVVGWRAEALWLIAQFDTTDLEGYFAAEFPG